MLIRNCVSNLFKENDENVRVTIFKKNPRFYVTGGYMHSFLETVRNSLGPGICYNSTEDFCFFLIYEVADNILYKEIDCHGNEIMEEIKKFIAVTLETFGVPLINLYTSGTNLIEEKNIWDKKRIVEEIQKDANYLKHEASRNYRRR